MAGEYVPKTDYFQEVFDVLKISKEAEHPWGGKKLPDEMWASFMKHIVDGDQELFELGAAGRSFEQQFQASKASPDDSLVVYPCEYVPKTDYFQEVFDVLKIAKEAEHPWGGKKLPDEIWASFMKHIVDGEQELFELGAAGHSFEQQFQASKASPDDSLAQLELKEIELVELQVRVDVNLMHMKRLIRHAQRLKGMLVASYI